MTFRLVGADGRRLDSPVRGRLGGHRAGRRYGRLDCPAALRALALGGYASERVFFADEATAVAAGYRPCARCLPEAYRRWRHTSSGEPRVAPARVSSGRAGELTRSFVGDRVRRT